MNLSRLSFALGIVLVLSLGLVGSALAHHKPDHSQGPPAHAQSKQGPPAHAQGRGNPAKGRALQGVVTGVDLGGDTFSLEVRRFEDDVTVRVNEDTKYRMPGGKRLAPIFSGPASLDEDDQVVVRGNWGGEDFNAAEVRMTGRNLKRFNGVASEVNGEVTVTKGSGEAETFSLTDAVILGGTLEDGKRVQVIHRKDSDVALGVIVRLD